MENDPSPSVDDGEHERSEGVRLVPKHLPDSRTFTLESEQWNGRTMLPVLPPHPDIACGDGRNGRAPERRSLTKTPEARLSVVSYNVLADSNIWRVRNCPENLINWERRRERLLKEIFDARL